MKLLYLQDFPLFFFFSLSDEKCQEFRKFDASWFHVTRGWRRKLLIFQKTKTKENFGRFCYLYETSNRVEFCEKVYQLFTDWNWYILARKFFTYFIFCHEHAHLIHLHKCFKPDEINYFILRAIKVTPSKMSPSFNLIILERKKQTKKKKERDDKKKYFRKTQKTEWENRPRCRCDIKEK